MATRADVRTRISTLVGTDPHLTTAEINTLIQTRFEILYEVLRWSKSLRDFTISLTALEDSTTSNVVTVTNGSATVTSDGTPFTSGTDDDKQLKIEGEEQYFFFDIDSSSQVTLTDGEGNDITWAGDTDTDATWTMFQTVYALPSGLDTVISLAGEQSMEEMDGGRDALDLTDPDRDQTSDHPWKWMYAGVNSDGDRKIEVWPVPTEARILRGQAGRSAPTLADATVIDINPSLLVYATAADCLNMLFAKTGDDSHRQLALFYERKANEAFADIGPRELEKLSLPTTIRRSSGRTSRLRGTDYEVDHLLEEP